MVQNIAKLEDSASTTFGVRRIRKKRIEIEKDYETNRLVVPMELRTVL
jgi:hypothetical protein